MILSMMIQRKCLVHCFPTVSSHAFSRSMRLWGSQPPEPSPPSNQAGTDPLTIFRNKNNRDDQVFSAMSSDGGIKVTACTIRNLVNDAMIQHTMTKTPADILGRTIACSLLMANGIQDEQMVQITLNCKSTSTIPYFCFLGIIILCSLTQYSQTNKQTYPQLMDQFEASLQQQPEQGRCEALLEVPHSEKWCFPKQWVEAQCKSSKTTLPGHDRTMESRLLYTEMWTEISVSCTYIAFRSLISMNHEGSQILLPVSPPTQPTGLYLAESEQRSCALAAATSIDNILCKAAGGYLIEQLPDVDEETIKRVQANLSKLVELDGGDKLPTNLLLNGITPVEIAQIILEGLNMQPLGQIFPSLTCKCSEERLVRSLRLLPRSEVEDILEKEEQVEARCEFCAKIYRLSPEQVRERLDATVGDPSQD